MNTLQELIDKGLHDHLVMESPRQNADTSIYSVYCPAALVTAYKAVCEGLGLSHPAISRQLMAHYVQENALAVSNGEATAESEGTV